MSAPIGDDWLPIETAKTTGPVEWVEVWNGQAVEAHFARDLSGESQPAFEGWFKRIGPRSFSAIYPSPTHWRPIAAASPARTEPGTQQET